MWGVVFDKFMPSPNDRLGVLETCFWSINLGFLKFKNLFLILVFLKSREFSGFWLLIWYWTTVEQLQKITKKEIIYFSDM